MRSENEIKLRDDDALNYDEWYLERGLTAVETEDETILSKLPFSKNDNFLDFGCGTGRFTFKCLEQNPTLNIYGLDISPKSIEVLNNKQTKIIAKNFDASENKIKDLDFPKFDSILSMQMIQHLEKSGAVNAVNQIYTNLNRGG